MSIEIIGLSAAKQRLLELARQVDEGGKRFLFVRDGVPVSVLIPVEEYQAWVETLEVLEDRRAVASLRRALRDVRAGRVYRRLPDGRFERVRRKKR
jgi:prevent-host-death family protein